MINNNMEKFITTSGVNNHIDLRLYHLFYDLDIKKDDIDDIITLYNRAFKDYLIVFKSSKKGYHFITLDIFHLKDVMERQSFLFHALKRKGYSPDYIFLYTQVRKLNGYNTLRVAPKIKNKEIITDAPTLYKFIKHNSLDRIYNLGILKIYRDVGVLSERFYSIIYNSVDRSYFNTVYIVPTIDVYSSFINDKKGDVKDE